MKIPYRVLVFCLSSWIAVSATAQSAPSPEATTDLHSKTAVHGKHFMVTSANPLATQAGYEILRQGGSATDAAIATQLVLNLVEPQSSGIGGGAFILHYAAASKKLSAFDGRETAPAAAKPERFLNAENKPMPFSEAVAGGKSVGVPGTLKVMELAHKKNGKLPWARLFEPAIKLAEKGFPVSERLNQLLAKDKYLPLQPVAKAYFYEADGSPRAVGYQLKNPELADALRRIAKEGSVAFYKGDIARNIVATVSNATNPGDITEADLAGYQAKEREALCGPYRIYKVCGMPLPSSGTITILQMLGMLERFPMWTMASQPFISIHLFSEAGSLAFADRNRYLADSDFVTAPVKAMLNPAYLQQRAMLIKYDDVVKAMPGEFDMPKAAALADDKAIEMPSTSHISIVDRAGNVVAMTTTIEDAFGSRLMVNGFLLNNEMTDFSFQPQEDGKPVANKIEPGKRPRSSMAPTIVFDKTGKVKMVVGSAGGSSIINYVAKTLVGVLDWNLDIQQAIALPNFGSRNGPLELEQDTGLDKWRQSFRGRGHEVEMKEMNSGLQGIMRTSAGWMGGVDPRREGLAMGD